MSTVTPTGLLPEIPGTDQLSKILITLSDPGFWMRAGVIVLGGALVIIGVVTLLAGVKGVQQAASLATGIVTKGVIK